MITKITSQNIGCLSKFASPELHQFVLAYGRNGSGKSTVAAIIGSLENNDGTAIEERTTIQSKESPHASIQAGTESIEFDGSWKGQFEFKLAVFDDDFVNKNIHSGGQFDNDHKKRLYSIVLGENCHESLERLKEAEEESKAHNAQVKLLEREIEHLIPSDFSLSEFQNLRPVPDIENKIALQHATIRAINERENLNNADDFSELELPKVANSIYRTLRKSIQTMAVSAESTVKNHLKSATNNATTSWLEDGLAFQFEDNCPFCGAETLGNSILVAYQGFFSDEYNNLKAEVKSLGGLVDSCFGESMLLEQQRLVDENRTAEQFWQQYIKIPPLDHSVFEEFTKDISSLREKAHEAISKKQSSPLEPVELEDLQFDSSLQSRIADYNSLVSVVNERIESFRDSSQSVELRHEEHKLSLLLAAEQRHSAEMPAKLEELASSNSVKKALAAKKKSLKAKIETETSLVFAKHGKEINKLLEILGANFRLQKLTTNNMTKPPSAKIFLEYSDGVVALGSSTNQKQRVFRSTLSGGERAMLGFAFFYARLVVAPNKSDHVCVIDDPVSNLDRERIDGIAKLVSDFFKDCRQLIVLSHSQPFLAALDSELDAQLLEFKSSGGSTLLENVGNF